MKNSFISITHPGGTDLINPYYIARISVNMKSVEIFVELAKMVHRFSYPIKDAASICSKIRDHILEKRRILEVNQYGTKVVPKRGNSRSRNTPTTVLEMHDVGEVSFIFPRYLAAVWLDSNVVRAEVTRSGICSVQLSISSTPQFVERELTRELELTPPWNSATTNDSGNEGNEGDEDGDEGGDDDEDV